MSAIDIVHITGHSDFLEKNEFNQPKRRTVYQMFFTPYQSQTEFGYCFKRTFIPGLFIGMIAALPIQMALGTAAMYVSQLLPALVGGACKLFGADETASLFLDIAYNSVVSLTQLIVDAIVLPISIMMMLTRGVATIMHRNDAEQQPLLQEPIISIATTPAPQGI